MNATLPGPWPAADVEVTTGLVRRLLAGQHPGLAGQHPGLAGRPVAFLAHSADNPQLRAVGGRTLSRVLTPTMKA